ncbi:MAG: GAF domain-containing protein [Chloroflexota bacterium]
MKILYVEDEIAHVVLAQRTLEENIQQKFDLIHAETMKDALRLLDADPGIDLVLSDLRLPDGTGLELLKKVRERKSAPAVVLVTGQGDQEVAVAALKAGAADYLVKQSDYLHRLPVVISNAIAQNRLLREQEALRQAEIKYQSLVEQISAVVFLDKADGRETSLYISPRVEELTGYTPDEWYAIPDLWSSLIHPEDRERILAADKKSNEMGTRFLEEYRFVTRDGSIVWIKEDTNLIRDKDDDPLYWQGILLDITKEKESLEIIRKSEERFRRIFHASPISTCVVCMDDGKFIDANQAYLDLIAKSFEDLLMQDSIEMGWWKDKKEQRTFVEQLQENGTLQAIEHQFQNVPAGTKDTMAYYELIELGGKACILAMFYDTTREKKAQKALQAERDFALQVLNNMGQGLTVTTKEGKFRYVNPAYASMLGYKSDEMLGQSPADFASETSRDQFESERTLRRQGVTTTYETRLLHKDLHEVPALITGVPRWDENEVTGTIAVITDLTESKKTEEALARQVKELTVLHTVAIAEAESESEDEIIERVTKITGQIYPELCGFLLLNENGDQLTPHPSYIGADIRDWQKSYPITSGITGRAVGLDKIIRTGDVTQEAGYIEIASEIRSELCIPIRINGRVIGILNVESKMPDAFMENDERFLNTIASSVGTALERLRFFKEEQRRSRELNALYQATKSIAQSLEPQIIAQNLITTMDELLGYEFASLYLLDDDGQNLIPMAISQRAQNLESYETDMELLRHQNRILGQGIIGWVAQHGQSIRTGNVSSELHYLPVIKNIQSELCVPLVARGRVIGALNVESTQPHAYSERDESFLTALANSAAISFENARLYQDALRASERRAVLHRISQDIVRFAQDFEQIYIAIHEAATKLMACDAFIIALRDESKAVNTPVYTVEAGTRLKWESMPANAGITATVINEGKTIILTNEAEISKRHVVHFGSTRHVQSLVAVPMRISNNIIGMISAQSYEPDAYGMEEQALLEMLATHAATAIENGRLFDSEQKRRQEAENLRQAATAMSSTLDPAHVMVDILRALKQVIHYDNASVFLHEGDWLRLAVCQGFADAEKLIGLKFPAGDELFQQIQDTRRPVIIGDAQKDSRFKGWGNSFQIHGWMSVPLITRGRVIGCITLDNYKQGAYDEAIIETALAFANQAAVTLENARLFDEQIRRSKIIEALADIANEIATTREVLPVLEQITRRALDMLSANHVAIYLLQDDQATLKTVAAHGIYQSELLGHTIKAGEGITGSIFLRAKAEIINDTTQDPRKVTVPGTPEKEEKLESLMSSPLILRGRTIGVINAWRLKENGLFNESELNFLVGIAHQVSICIESGRLFQETSRQAQEAAAIAEVGRDISATLQLDVVLERIASYAMDLLHSETSAVYLADENLLHAIASFGIDAEEIKNDPLTVGTGILGNIALQNAGEIVNNTAHDPRTIIVKGTEKNPLEHLMGVPIVLKDKHTGLLAVWRSGAGTDFAPRELEFLTSLARQAAVAIENARLYDETQRRVKELEIINSVSTSLRLAHSMEEMLPILLDETLGLLDTPHGSIWMYDHMSNKLMQKIAHGAESKLRYTSLSPVEGIVGRTFTSGEKYISPNLKNDPLLFELNRDTTTAGLAGICIPIESTVGPVGVLMVMIDQGRQMTEAINLLSILAEITGNSIHRLQLYEQSQKQVKRLTSLRDIDAAIASSFDLRLTLNILMDQTLNHLNVDAVDIGLYHPDIQSITYVASTGFQTAVPTRPQLRLSESLAGQTIIKQSILHVTDLQNAREARNELLLRREGFVTYIGIPLIVKGQIKGVFEVFHRRPLSPTLDWMEFLHTLAGQAAIAIDSSQLFENLQRSNQELMQAYDTTLEGWARALELRDRETEGHTRRVTELTMLLARFMGISDSELVNIHRGVLLHDIGKMGVPDHILKKTGELDANEWVEMRQHPIYAYNLLSPISYLRRALDIPYCHHEHWDGSGYPRGLKGEQIPLSARIFSVVDIWDALLSDRPYRKAWPREKVIQYLRDVAGIILDPRIVEIFFKMLEGEKSQTG